MGSLEIAGQTFPGYYLGQGRYKFRFVPKVSGDWSYQIHSELKEFDGLEGKFVSADPWPGESHPDNINNLTGWWSDDPSKYEGAHQGAKSVYKWREDFMRDWAERWQWLEE